MLKENIITGIWKFSDKVPSTILIDVAKQWSEEDKNYLQLYIRKVSKDQNGIGFMYQNPGSAGAEAEYDAFFHKTTDWLKRKFGNDLVGWDISSSVYIIK